MKKMFSFAVYVMAAMAMALAMGSCKKEKIETMEVGQNSILYDDPGIHYGDLREPTNDSIAPIISSNLPVFPFEVLYVVNKEYELVVEGRSAKTTYNGAPILSYQQPIYVELRLIELYPDLAYEGVMEDSRYFYDSVSRVYDTYLMGIQGTGNRDYKPDFPYISEENEMVLMEMTEMEKKNYIQYTKLAGMERFASLDDISKASGKNLSMDAKFNWVLFGCICALVVDYGSYAYYRAKICAERATSKANEYFLGNTGAGKKGDAFRHIAVNVMLRYYLGQTVAYLIMDVYYETYDNPNPFPCDTHMDLHNNSVGRLFKYYYFRIDDNWLEWMVRIKDFINDSSNAAYKNWNSMMSGWTVYWDRFFTSPFKYIYYKS